MHESFGLGSPGSFERFGSRGDNLSSLAVMQRRGCHQADSAVVMLLVIPVEESPTERQTIFVGTKSFWELWTVLGFTICNSNAPNFETYQSYLTYIGTEGRVQLLSLAGNATSSETIYVANDRLKVILVADILDEHDGMEILATGSDGQPQVLWKGRLGWHHETFFSDPWGQSRINVGPDGIVIGGDGGKVAIARRSNGQWKTECVGRDSAKIRGVVWADLDPALPGAEVYSAGYSGRVLQFSQTDEGYWIQRVIYAGDQTLHHLAVGEIDSRHDGPD